MAKETFSNKKVNKEKLHMIAQASAIIREYVAAGYTLTLRQLYYQFVSRDLLANDTKNYKKLGDAVSDGRMLGLLDWDAIEDRTRGVEIRSRWEDPASIIKAARDSYHVDMWSNQARRVEVWIEKEALVGVIESVCREFDVPYLACRGYVSQSEQWRAYKRLQASFEGGQGTLILHMGDHDPSGVDMTRDNRDRLSHFMLCAQARNHKRLGLSIDQSMTHLENGARGIEVRRIALTMDQIDEHTPPPNPAKATDSRFEQYAAQYGDESWELDALDPPVLVELIREHIKGEIDRDKWAEREDEMASDVAKLDTIVNNLTEE